MDVIDKMVGEMMETREVDIREDSAHEPLRMLDEEDVEDLMIDCLSVIEELIKRAQPRFLLSTLTDLQTRLAEVVNYSRIH